MKAFWAPLVMTLVVLWPAGAQSQVLESGDLTDHIDTLIAGMPTTREGGDYLQPGQSSRTQWREIIDHILAGEYAEAHTKAQTMDYQVVLFTDMESAAQAVHVVLERTPESTAPYWGTFVFNTAPKRPHLVIECPHPRFDLNTGYQGIRIYQHTAGKAFMVSGTHRCNGLGFSPCEGTSSVCGESNEAYRHSDQAHVVDGTFQLTTEALMANDPALLVVQPHGFSQREDDPDLIISNGTRFSPAGIDYTTAIRDALQAVDPTLAVKVAHVDQSWTRLIGSTNTQGRLINNSSSPCGTAATSASGGFVHIEQARGGLRDTPANWMKLAQAIAEAVPE